MAIAKLSIDLEARLTKLESDLKQATALADKAASQMQASFKGLALTFTGLAGALSVGAIKGVFDRYVEGAANLQKLAIVAGTTTENMSGLAAVAKLSGTDVDQLSGGMVRLSAALSKSDDEAKGAGRAFAALQLDPAKLRTMDTAKALQEVAGAFSKVEDGSSKTALAVSIFGKAGAQLLPYLKELADSGGLVTKITTEQGIAAKEYEQNLKRLEVAQGAVAKTIASEVLPAASTFVKTLAELISNTDGVASAAKGLARDGSIRAWADAGAVGIANLIDALQLAKRLVIEIATPIERLGRNIYNVGAIAGIGGGSGTIEEKTQALAALKKESESYFAALDKRLENNRKTPDLFSDKLNAAFGRQTTDRFLSGKAALNEIEHPTKRKVVFAPDPDAGGSGRTKAAKAIDDGQRLVEQLRDRIRGMETLTELEKLESEIQDGKYKTATPRNLEIARGYAVEIDALKKVQEESAKAKQEFMAMSAEGARIFEESRTPIEALDARIEHLNELLNRGAISIETFGRAAQKAGEEFQAIKKPLDEMDQFAIQAARNIQDAFAEFLFDPFAKGTESMLQGFGNAIKRMIANAVAADLAKRLFGDLSKVDGVGGLVGKGLDWLKGAIPSANGNVFDSPGLSAYSGSVVSRPTVFPFARGIGLMGERGPEAILPLSRDGSGKLGVRGGGHSVVVNISMGAGAGASDVRRAGGAVAREVLGVLSNSRRFA